jgi:hypothetical protein
VEAPLRRHARRYAPLLAERFQRDAARPEATAAEVATGRSAARDPGMAADNVGGADRAAGADRVPGAPRAGPQVGRESPFSRQESLF